MGELLTKTQTKIQVFFFRGLITHFRRGEWNGSIQKGLKIKKGKNLDVIL